MIGKTLNGAFGYVQMRTLIGVFTFTSLDFSGFMSWVCKADGPSSGCADAQADLDPLSLYVVEHHFA